MEAGLALDPRPVRGEKHLNLRFFQRHDTLWAPAGFEVGWAQLAFPIRHERKSPIPPKKSLGVETAENETTLTLRSGEMHAVFDKAAGLLVDFGVGTNLLLRGPLLNVWRAATDNDCVKLFLDGRDPLYTTGKPLPLWLKLGLNHVRHSLARIRLIRPKDGLPFVEIIHQASGREQWDDFRHIHRYSLSPAGELVVENIIKIGKEPTDLARIGVSLVLDPALEQLEWFGRGPWENYPDRKAAAMIGHYRSTVTDQYVPYVMPQEHGHKTDVRWLELTAPDGHGLRFLGEPILEFSASHLTENDLYDAFHTYELQPQPEVHLNLDAVMRGLGSASCGPDTLEPYKMLEKEYHFTYRLQLR